jgi:hypothetical protein
VAAHCLFTPQLSDFSYRVVHETCTPLTRALQCAGFPRIVAPLWRLNAASSSDVVVAAAAGCPMMREVAQGSWVAEATTVAEALRRLQLRHRSEGAPIAVWGCLRLSGLQ